jgi:GAF domain
VGSDPQELAATLRQLARLDPVELGLAAVLERIVQAAATGCDSTGGVGLLLLGPDGQLRYVVAAGRPRRLLAGAQGRLAEGPSVEAFVQAAPVSSSDLAAEPRWPNFRLLALAAGIRAWLSVPVHQHHGPSARSTSPTPTPGRGGPTTWRPPTPTPSCSWRPCGWHRTAGGAALPGAAVRGPARHPDRAGAWRHHAARTARPGRCGRVALSTSPDRGPTDPSRRRTPPRPPPTLTDTQARPDSPQVAAARFQRRAPAFSRNVRFIRG